MKRFSYLVVLLLFSVIVMAADTPGTSIEPVTADKTPAATTKEPEKAKTVTLEASEKPIREALAELAKSAGETILVESLVEGTITAKIENVTVEKALDVVCKNSNIQWRKILVNPSAAYAKDADALAAQMRTVLALRLPDIAISSAGSGGSYLHVQKELTANEVIKAIPASAGLTTVYLVTDDAKAYKKELKDQSKKKVAKYIDAQRELTEEFLEMTPEERKEAMKASLNMMNQLGPEAMRDMMTSMFEMDPDYVFEMNRMGMQAMFSMTPEARRNLLRMSMRQQMDVMNSLTPEQSQQLMEDIQAITQEMQSGQ